MTSGSESLNSAGAQAGPARRPKEWVIVPAMAVLMGLQPVTTDLYLPALPALRADLQSTMAATQLTLSALLLSFGLSQLFMGPLADRHGRRPVLLLGLVIYAIATVASALAPSMAWLIVCRVVQGVGMAAALVCSRAMMRDLFEPHHGARVMARSLSGLGVIAFTGPIAGAVLVSLFGWRSTFVACAVYVAMAIALLVWQLPETLARRNLQATQFRPMLKTWRHITTHRAFVAWSLLIACTYGAIYTYLAGSAFVFLEVLGTSRLHYGMVLSATTLIYIVGTLYCHRWLQRNGPLRTVRRGARFSIAGALGLIVIVATGWKSPLAVLLCCSFITFGHAQHQPCAQAAVTGPFPASAGTASALAGFFMSTVAFAIGGWLGWAMNGTLAPVLLTQAFFALATAAVALSLVQRHGDVSGPHGAQAAAQPVSG